MADKWDEGVVYLKATTKEGGETFTRHTCWNKKLFVKKAHETATREGGRAEQITQEEFQENR